MLPCLFSMNAMLRKNVLSPEDKPIWFEIYALHPPHTEPRYDQEAPDKEIRDILYEEDIIRAYVYQQIILQIQPTIQYSYIKKNKIF